MHANTEDNVFECLRGFHESGVQTWRCTIKDFKAFVHKGEVSLETDKNKRSQMTAECREHTGMLMTRTHTKKNHK